MSDAGLDRMEEALRITWSLFVAIEKDDQDTIDAICEQYDDATLLEGWHLVAAYLRKVIIQHASAVGCSCGDDHWLEVVRLSGFSHED